MPLTFADSPPGLPQAVARLRRLLIDAPTRGEAGPPRDWVGPVTARLGPIPVHVLPAAGLPPRPPLRVRAPVAWRYLILGGEGVVATADFGVKRNGGYRFREAAVGLAGDWETSLNAAVDLLEVRTRGYEVHTVLAPAVGLTAVWLRAASGGRAHDLFRLVGRTCWPFEAGQWYEPARFLARLQKSVHARAAARRAAGGGRLVKPAASAESTS